MNQQLHVILITQMDSLLPDLKDVLANQREYCMAVLVHEGSDWKQ